MPAGPVPDAFHDILESKAFAVATTLGSTGEPHVNPIWFLWNGEHILLSLWGNRQKFRNLQRDARIAIAFADPANPYRYLDVRGRVERLDSDASRLRFALASEHHGPDGPGQRMIGSGTMPDRAAVAGRENAGGTSWIGCRFCAAWS